jgi:hypothetical protein
MQALYRSSKVSIERGDETRVITQPPSGPPPIPEDAVRPESSNAPPPEATSNPARASVDAYARLAAGDLRPSSEELVSLHSIDTRVAVTETGSEFHAVAGTGPSVPETDQQAAPSRSYIRDLSSAAPNTGPVREVDLPSAFRVAGSVPFEPVDVSSFRPSARGYLIFWTLTLGSFFALAYLLSP